MKIVHYMYLGVLLRITEAPSASDFNLFKCWETVSREASMCSREDGRDKRIFIVMCGRITCTELVGVTLISFEPFCCMFIAVLNSFALSSFSAHIFGFVCQNCEFINL